MSSDHSDMWLLPTTAKHPLLYVLMRITMLCAQLRDLEVEWGGFWLIAAAGEDDGLVHAPHISEASAR